jgi:DNA-binding CsgD family transcriptional regulator
MTIVDMWDRLLEAGTVVALVGREREQDAIRRLLAGVRDRGAALVVHGEAGVGKSALLEAAAGMAAGQGMRVLHTTGTEAERNLPFAALHQLLRPVLAQARALPPPHRDAIQAAFAMTDGAAPELFLIAMAALGLLTEAAGDAPLVMIADDAQWMDSASAEVLAFMARRVEWDPVIMLISLRDGYDAPLVRAGLPTLRVAALGERAARELLEKHHRGLAAPARDRLLAEAEGNPLALLELPATLDSGTRSGEALLPSHLLLTARLEHAFTARMAELPAATRVLLLVAAADDTTGLGEIMTAAGIVAGAQPTVESLDPAVQAGLVSVDGLAVRFRHPLVRSAAYQAATVAELHAVHAALAEVLSGDPDRRVWHRAAAVVGPDSAVAAELAETAARARRRGGLVTAVAGYERAAALTREPDQRGAMLLRAAEAASELGRSEMVRRLLREADSLDLGPRDRAQSLWLGYAFPGGSAKDPEPVRALVETARAMTGRGDSDLALSLLSTAARLCYWGGLSGGPAADVLDAADQTGVAADHPRLVYIQANVAPLERGAVVLAHLARYGPTDDPGVLQLLGAAATITGAFDQAFRLFGKAEARLREQGRLGVLAGILPSRAWSAILAADFPAALTSAEEGAKLAAETGQPFWELHAWTAQATIAALRGDDATAEKLAAKVERTALPLGAAGNLALAQYARGLSAIGQGKHQEAYDQLRRVYQSGDPAHHPLFVSFDIGDLAEAAARSGHHDEARALMRHAESAARRTTSPWLHATLRYARAVLAEEDAEIAFKEAADYEGIARWPFLEARLQLAFGEWLRRQRRTSESRPPLRTARDAFDALGAIPWSQRARHELRAAGEASAHPARGTLDILTPQELQIVAMAAEGLSNREIGQRLYLSHRTVESHLYRAFPKLQITTRSQLPGVLSNPVRTTAPLPGAVASRIVGWARSLSEKVTWQPLIGNPFVRRTWAVWPAAARRRHSPPWSPGSISPRSERAGSGASPRVPSSPSGLLAASLEYAPFRKWHGQLHDSGRDGGTGGWPQAPSPTVRGPCWLTATLSASRSIGLSTESEPEAAECWWSTARPGWGRQRCWST